MTEHELPDEITNGNADMSNRIQRGNTSAHEPLTDAEACAAERLAEDITIIRKLLAERKSQAVTIQRLQTEATRTDTILEKLDEAGQTAITDWPKGSKPQFLDGIDRLLELPAENAKLLAELKWEGNESEVNLQICEQVLGSMANDPPCTDGIPWRERARKALRQLTERRDRAAEIRAKVAEAAGGDDEN